MCVSKKSHNLRYFFELTSFCVQRCFSGSASASLHPSNPKKNSNHPRAKRPSQYHIPDPHQTPATYLGETDVFVRVFCFKVLFIKAHYGWINGGPCFFMALQSVLHFKIFNSGWVSPETNQTEILGIPKSMPHDWRMRNCHRSTEINRNQNKFKSMVRYKKTQQKWNVLS